MIVSISQPAYIPWLGYFDRIHKSDVAVVLDSVMLERSSKTRFTNRNKIKTEQGWTWLTIPVKTAGLGQPLIRDVLVDNDQDWCQKHWRTIKHSYSKSPFFQDHYGWFEQFYSKRWISLNDLLETTTGYLLRSLGITTPTVSSTNLSAIGQKADLILNICKELGATKYISGPFGREYLNLSSFDAAGIEVIFHDYEHPQYKQTYGGFQPFMSTIDLLFNHGPKSLEILKS